MMTESKQRLRPWLENILNENTVPGVCWLDDERTTFKIPWKHSGKQDWQPEDAKIFMLWAQHTGKYRENIDPKEFATWKTRLRCALSKAPDIEELRDQSNLDSAAPYRVYLFKERRERGPRSRSAPTSPAVAECSMSSNSSFPGFAGKEESQAGPIPTTVSEQILSEPMTSIDQIDTDQLIPMGGESMELGSLPSSKEFMNFTELPGDTSQILPGFTPQSSACAAIVQDVLPTASPQYGPVVGGACAYPPMAAHSVSDYSSAGFTVTLFYCNASPTPYTVTNQDGCRILHNTEISLQDPSDYAKVYGPKDADSIFFDPRNKFENINEAIVHQLYLPNLTRGVHIQMEENGDIYVTRYCKLGVFVAAASSPSNVVKLDRDKRTRIFSPQDHIIECRKNMSIQTEPPKADVHILFGKSQEAVKNVADEEILKSVLLMAVVKSNSASKIHEYAMFSYYVDHEEILGEEMESIYISKSDEIDRFLDQNKK